MLISVLCTPLSDRCFLLLKGRYLLIFTVSSLPSGEVFICLFVSSLPLGEVYLFVFFSLFILYFFHVLFRSRDIEGRCRSICSLLYDITMHITSCHALVSTHSYSWSDSFIVARQDIIIFARSVRSSTFNSTKTLHFIIAVRC